MNLNDLGKGKATKFVHINFWQRHVTIVWLESNYWWFLGKHVTFAYFDLFSKIAKNPVFEMHNCLNELVGLNNWCLKDESKWFLKKFGWDETIPFCYFCCRIGGIYLNLVWYTIVKKGSPYAHGDHILYTVVYRTF